MGAVIEGCLDPSSSQGHGLKQIGSWNLAGTIPWLRNAGKIRKAPC